MLNVQQHVQYVMSGHEWSAKLVGQSQVGMNIKNQELSLNRRALSSNHRHTGKRETRAHGQDQHFYPAEVLD